MVDNFGVKYIGNNNAQHLINALTTLVYTVSTNWTAPLYCGLTISWDSKINMATYLCRYIGKALHNFKHPVTYIEEVAPHGWNKPTYSATIQYALKPNNIRLLPGTHKSPKFNKSLGHSSTIV
jgi:hypothetical protein